MNSQPSALNRMARATRNLFLFIVFVVLAGGAAYAASLLNMRTYKLETRGLDLVVLRGTMIPFRFAYYQPPDALQADAYAPLNLEGTPAAPNGATFGDRDQLDRALFGVIEGLLRPKLASDDARDLETAADLVKRAGYLRGLTADQNATLKKLGSEFAYYVAQTRLQEARRELEEALTQLKIAADTDGRHRDQANAMLLSVAPQVRELATAIQETSAIALGKPPAGNRIPAPTPPAGNLIPAPTPSPSTEAPAAIPAPP